MAPLTLTLEAAPPTALSITTSSLLTKTLATMAAALHSQDSGLNVVVIPTPEVAHPVGPFRNLAVDGNWIWRTSFTAVSLFCMMILALMLGSRAKHLKFNDLKSMNFMRFLVIALHITAMIFVATTALLNNAGMNQTIVCFTGSYVCLGFYVLNKSLMYMFMIERAHSIRAPYTRRLKDYVWTFWMFFSGLGFATLVVIGFYYPHTKVVAPGATCEMGLPRGVSIALLLFDVVINFVITGVFIWLIRPLLAFRRSRDPDSRSYFRDRLRTSLNTLCSRVPFTFPETSGPYHHTVSQSLMGRVEWLVWKTIAATFLTVIPTIANLVSLTAVGGREHAWVCFAVCTADITWSVCVIHWLTVDPLEVDNRPTSTSAVQSSISRPDVETPIQRLRGSSSTELTPTKE